ncbi:MAG: hypothetical protein II370_08450, partial [Clostridia bacterium]|nr:hypothetical protein [Clostridia bacterium]
SGKKIETKLEEFEKIALSKRIEGSLVDLMYDLKFSGLMEKMLNIFPGKRIEIKDMVVQETYLNLYYNLVQFEKIKNRLMEYDFEKQDKTYRKPSDDELVEWVKVQMEIRKKYPYVDDVLKQINNIQN